MTEWIRFLALLSLAIYFLVDYLDGRRVPDEREELIRLKSLELAHKASLAALSALAFIYIFHPSLDAQVVILALVAATLYTEIAGKLYFRAKL